MKRPLVLAVSVGASLLVATATLDGAVAAASGPDYSGQTYADASAQIASGGGTPVIATVVGEQLQTGDCIVTGSRKASNLDSSGRSRGYQVLLDLNCNMTLAAPGKPGNSAASPAGRPQKQLIETGNWCSQPEQADYADCATFCAENQGFCTANF